MAAVESFLNEDSGAKKRRRQMIISILIGVVILHVAAGVVAGIFVVAKYIFPPPANFVVKKDIRLPAKKREHKMNMAALDAVAPKPTLSDKMQSTRPTAFSLPDVPDMPLDQMLPLDPSQLVADQVASISNTDALGTASGAAAAGSGGFGGKGLSFLGVESTGQRIMMLFDVSGTVATKAAAAGIPVEKIQEELINMINKLPITARFTVYQFASNYKPFSKELVPASPKNKEAAVNWIKSEWIFGGGVPRGDDPNPEGIVGLFKRAAEIKPDVIFVVSDGVFSSVKGTFPEPGSTKKIPINYIKQATTPLKDIGCKVNFIIFEADPEDSRELKQISAMTKGTTKEFKK
jgi:hypothetical protein